MSDNTLGLTGLKASDIAGDLEGRQKMLFIMNYLSEEAGTRPNKRLHNMPGKLTETASETGDSFVAANVIYKCAFRKQNGIDYRKNVKKDAQQAALLYLTPDNGEEKLDGLALDNDGYPLYLNRVSDGTFYDPSGVIDCGEDEKVPAIYDVDTFSLYVPLPCFPEKDAQQLEKRRL